MEYKHLIIYYFSGTGNARNAALWMEEMAEENDINSKLICIDRFDEIDVPEFTGRALIGFCSPTHGFNLPPLALKFICNFPSFKNADVFILNTRGGLKLSRFFIPGISGIAQLLPAMILRIKGFRVVGMQPLDLPSNWLILHPGLREKVIASIYKRCRGIVQQFILNLLHGKRKYKALLSIPIDLLMLPIAFGYYFFGRFFLAKTLLATTDCNLCEKCIHECPVSAIRLVDKRPYWTYKCESCMRCVNICPVRAIQTTHAFAISMFIISSAIMAPLMFLLLKYLGLSELVKESALSKNIWSIIYTILFMGFVFISYRILHYLMKYKLVNRIIAYTSLSKYRFWRRYKAGLKGGLAK